MTALPLPSLISYQAATEAFKTGKDTPREFLERSIERLDVMEPKLRAFTALSLPRARIAADAATIRWRDGSPLSPIDGMPVGIKDLIETFDMPTGMGSPTHDGNQSLRDAASVFALREAGAAVLGKTKTTEFAGGYATDTRNPHDLTRTPGGSSSGSAAAVGAGILPAALGTQVIGSVLRPAGFCGAFGYKPTFGVINRGGSHDFQSHSCIGVIGASLADIWCTTWDITQRAGGDPGEQGLFGAKEMAAPLKPKKLIQLETAGWASASTAARQQLEDKLSALSSAGVEIMTRRNSAEVDALEKAIVDMRQLGLDIIDYEGRWPMKAVAYRDRLGLSPYVLSRIVNSDALGPDGYRALLKRRNAVRAQFEALASQADAFITLDAPGAAPKGLLVTGDPVFNVPASVLGAPAITLPMFTDENMPLGLQLISGQHNDAKLFATAGWVLSGKGVMAPEII